MNICSPQVAATQFAVYMASANLALSAGNGMTAALLTYRVIDSAVYSEHEPLATSDFVDRLEVVVPDMSHSVTSGQSGDEARQLSEVSSLRLGVLLFRLQLRQGPSEFRFNRRVEPGGEGTGPLGT